MKKLVIYTLLVCFIFGNTGLIACANPNTLQSAAVKSKTVTYNKNARTLKYAFVFDGPSDKNAQVMEQFKKAITYSTAPEYKASFSKDLIFTGDWTDAGAKKVAAKAMNSNAQMVVSLGWFVSNALNTYPKKNKFVLTIDQYGLRDFGDGFFNPVQQSIKGAVLFAKLVPFKNAAVLMNENFYKTKSDWNGYVKNKIPNMNVTILPVGQNIDSTLAKLSNYDAVIVTPLFNLSTEKRKELYTAINQKKIPSYSTFGKEDVELGVLMGTGAYDIDRKVAEATSFNIKSVVAGNKPAPQKVQFYEDELLYINKDTADFIGYQPHLRILNTAQIISHKQLPVMSLASVFDDLYKDNLDIARKRLLIKAARRSAISAALRYLPTASMTVGYQTYDGDYAESAKLSLPQRTGVFKMGIDQVIFSPALITNILVKKKGLDFSKSEAFMTEQNMGIDVALLYLDTLLLDNLVQIQKENVKESRENLAIARVREKRGFCGREESLRWASELNVEEQKLLDMTAELKNQKIAIQKILNKGQGSDFTLAPIKANDKAFFTSEINIINHLGSEQNLDKFINMLVEESFRVSPELAKLRAAKKMKDYELAMYVQKFVLPDAKLSVEYTSLANRHFTSDIPAYPMATAGGAGPDIPLNKMLNRPNATNLYFGIFAQWKPIEGGTKFAEIARVKAEKDELQKYEEEIKTELEQEVRQVVNRAIAGYFSINNNYKAMFASAENYQTVKSQYLAGKVPVSQLIDAQEVYLDSKAKAINSQYTFFKEVIWVQRAICSVDWTKAPKEAHDFIKKLRTELPYQEDITLL